jgi:integrase
VSIKGRKLTSGRTVYDVRLRDPQGRAYKRTFPTKREAETFEATQRVDRVRGAWIDPRKSSTTFADVAASWLASNPAKRETTRARDEIVVRVHLLPVVGDRPVGSITPADVQALVNGWCRQKAPNTVRRQYSVLAAVMAAAVLSDLIARSPCRGIKLPGTPHAERHIVTADELAALAEALGEDFGLMAYLGAVLGLRWGEVAGLRVGRLDFLRATLAVAEQVTQGPRGVTVVGAPKSAAGRRTLTVPPELMDRLAGQLSRRGLTGADPAAFVFATPSGTPLDYAHWRQRVWLPATRVAGLTGLTFHDLRRANATGLVAEGIDMKTAQTRLGHSDPRLTLAVYAQATTEADRSAAARIGARFFPSEPQRARRI